MDKLMNFCLFLYLCAITAHKTGEGFDAIFLRVTFVLYVGSTVLNMFVEKNNHMRLTNYTLWLLLFFGFCYVSYIWAVNKEDVMLLSNTFIQIIGVALCLTQQLKSNEDIIKLLKMVNMSLVYSVILLIIKTPIESFGTDRIGDVLGLHANVIGLRLATGALISIFFFTRENINKWFYMLTLIVFSVLVLLTGSRKSISMILFCVLAYVVFYNSKDKNGLISIKKLLLCFSMITFLLVLWYLMMNVEYFYSVIGIRFESMLNTFLGTDSDGSMNEREFFANKAIELFKEHPVIGYGCNNFKQYMREIGYSHIAYSHNNFTELLCTLGIIGTSIFYVPLIAFTVYLIKHYVLNTKNTLGLVLLIFMSFTFLITSYAVIYNNEFHYIFFILTYMYCKINKVETRGENYEQNE